MCRILMAATIPSPASLSVFRPDSHEREGLFRAIRNWSGIISIRRFWIALVKHKRSAHPSSQEIGHSIEDPRTLEPPFSRSCLDDDRGGEPTVA